MERRVVRIAWVLGWAVPEAWFAGFARAHLPQAEHVFFAAAPDWLVRLAAAGPWDVIAGHSLGTLLLLQETAAVGRLAPRIVLLAPVLAFPKEACLGGRVSRTQIKYLSRWLNADRPAALADFYARAGLDGCPASEEPAGVLQWGLDRLAQDRVTPPLPSGWRGYAGADDALLDAEELRRLDPVIVKVAGATHHPETLIRAWALAPA